MKIFTDNIEENALAQIKELLTIDVFSDKKIRIMPDIHACAGCVIGFTGDLGDKVIPNIEGVDIGCDESYLSLRIQLDYTDYETYHIINGEDGHLTVSDIIWWQDLYCANSILNIQTGDSADEEDIPRCF